MAVDDWGRCKAPTVAYRIQDPGMYRNENSLDSLKVDSVTARLRDCLVPMGPFQTVGILIMNQSALDQSPDDAEGGEIRICLMPCIEAVGRRELVCFRLLSCALECSRVLSIGFNPIQS